MRKILLSVLFLPVMLVFAGCMPEGSWKDFQIVDKSIVAKEDGSFECSLKLSGDRTQRVICGDIDRYQVSGYIQLYVER